MKDTSFEDDYLNDDFIDDLNDDWNSETSEWDDIGEMNMEDISFDLDADDESSSWMEDIEDPDLLRDFDLEEDGYLDE